MTRVCNLSTLDILEMELHFSQTTVELLVNSRIRYR